MTLPERARAGRREWLGLVAIALPCLVYAMDVTVLHLAVPKLTVALRPSPSQVLWIVDIYGFLLAGSLITMGTLGDRIGRRRLLMIGAAAFVGASTLAAFSRGPEMLIAARALLGIAGATLAPSTLSLIRNMFHDEGQRTLAISVWGTSFATGGAVGPLVGGLLLDRWWWGSVFLLPVPVMGLLLILGPRLLPEFRDPRAGRLDIGSAALSVAAVLAVIYGLKRLAQNGFGAGLMAPSAVAGGVLLGVLFVRRQQRLAHPLIDLGLFRMPAVSVTIGALLLNVFAIFGVMFFNTQYLQLVLGLSPLRAGLWTVPSSLFIVASSLLSPRWAKLLPRPSVLVAGMLLCGLGFGIMALVSAAPSLGIGSLPLLVAGSIVWGIGAGPVGTLATDIVVGTAPPERAGSVASVSETSAELGGALGMAVLGSLGVAVYRLSLADSALPGLPEAARLAARSTLAEATVLSRTLSPTAREALLSAARDAFTHAFVTVAIAGAIVMLAAAIGMAAVFARIRRQERVPIPQ